jgi:hypothetical protein
LVSLVFFWASVFLSRLLQVAPCLASLSVCIAPGSGFWCCSEGPLYRFHERITFDGSNCTVESFREFKIVSRTGIMYPFHTRLLLSTRGHLAGIASVWSFVLLRIHHGRGLDQLSVAAFVSRGTSTSSFVYAEISFVKPFSIDSISTAVRLILPFVLHVYIILVQLSGSDWEMYTGKDNSSSRTLDWLQAIAFLFLRIYPPTAPQDCVSFYHQQ